MFARSFAVRRGDERGVNVDKAPLVEELVCSEGHAVTHTHRSGEHLSHERDVEREGAVTILERDSIY